MLQIGSVLDGKYKILNEIGHGGNSTVYLALNERANKTWAVKEIRKNSGSDNEAVSRGLVAETEMLKKLSHPGLPGIVDVINTDDSFIIVMDYVEGKSLQTVLNQEGPQNTEKVVSWAKQLTDVLGYLHNRRPPIIYRDMKPANIILKPAGEGVVLVDFGTAREQKETGQSDADTLGTMGYAAPEQFDGRSQTDARTDIYNLGATMYHLLTGYSPADTQYVIYPLGQIKPELAGSGIEKIVTKCCQPDPANRYQSCEELMYALNHIDEIGPGAVKSRNTKWYVFLACIALFILGIIGMIVSKAVEKNAVETEYKTCMEAAEAETDFRKAADLYKDAINMKPSRIDAYEGLYKKAVSDYEITAEESQVLSEYLGDMKALAESDKKGYAGLVYNLAADYCTEYSGMDASAKAGAYIASALESENSLSDVQKSTLQLMTKLIAFADPSSAGEEMKISDYFRTLEEYLDDPSALDAKTENKLLSLAVCRDAENLYSYYVRQLQDEKIKDDEISRLHDNADKYFKNFTDDAGLKNVRLYLEAESAFNNAKEYSENEHGGNPKGGH